MLLVQDHLLPEDEQRARYVDEFEILRDPSHNRAYAESAWIGMFQKAGLKVEHTEQIIKQHGFLQWAERQQCSPDVIQRLLRMVENASPAAAEWMQFRDFGTSEAAFISHHIIIAGRKVV